MLLDLARKSYDSAVTYTLPQPVVFHHVPKCGGTSVGRALRRRYILSQATVKPEESYRAFELFSGRSDREQMLVDVLDLREQMMMYHLFDNVQCVSLHVRFSQKAFARFRQRYRFVTMLREPVQRFISHYFWSYGKQKAHARIELSFEAFLETERARRLGATYGEYFSGLPSASDFSSSEAVEAAIGNLDQLDVVGRLDDLPRFQREIKRTTGARLRIGHENRSRRPQSDRPYISDATMAKVRELCAPDIEVWERTVGGGSR